MSPIEKIALTTGLVVGGCIGKVLHDRRAGIAAFLWLAIICFVLPIILWLCTFSYSMLLIAVLYSGLAVPAGLSAIVTSLVLKYATANR